MPNHCECELTIVGADADVRRFWAAVEASKDASILDAHFPMPEIYRNINLLPAGSGDRAWMLLADGDEYLDYLNCYDTWRARFDAWAATHAPEWVGVGSPPRQVVIAWAVEDGYGARGDIALLDMAAAQLAAIREHGAKNWYDWCRRNWGTKWGDYDLSEPGFSTDSKGRTVLSVGFLSAWSPPLEGFAVIAEQWPQLNFKLQYWEGGSGFRGTWKAEKGDVVMDNSYNYSGPRGG